MAQVQNCFQLCQIWQALSNSYITLVYAKKIPEKPIISHISRRSEKGHSGREEMIPVSVVLPKVFPIAIRGSRSVGRSWRPHKLSLFATLPRNRPAEVRFQDAWHLKFVQHNLSPPHLMCPLCHFSLISKVQPKRLHKSSAITRANSIAMPLFCTRFYRLAGMWNATAPVVSDQLHNFAPKTVQRCKCKPELLA